MKNTGPITVNGVHPITSSRVIDKGVAGSSSSSTPKPEQIASAGAKNVPGGHQFEGKPSSPLLAPNQAAEVKTAGTASEEMAKKFYPKLKGLRGVAIL